MRKHLAILTLALALPACGGGTPDPAPALALTKPWNGNFWSTLTSPLPMEGTASSASGLSSVTWTNELTGVSATATGTESWSALVPLGLGDNPIRITATDAAGSTSTRVMTVTYPAATPQPVITVTGPDTAPTGSLTVSTDIVFVEGTMSSPFGIVRLEEQTLETGSGALWEAPDSATWRILVMVAPTGTTTAVFTVTDGAGQTASTTVVITRN